MVVLGECLLEFLQPAGLSKSDVRHKFMRLRNLLGGFQKISAIDERKCLPCAIRPDGLNRDVESLQWRCGRKPHPEARRHAVFEYLKFDRAAAQVDSANVVAVIVGVIMPVRMTMAVSMMMTAGQQPRANDVDCKPQHGDRNCFAEADRDWVQEP